MTRVETGGLTFATQIKIKTLEALVAEASDWALAAVTMDTDMNISLAVAQVCCSFWF